MNALPSPKEMDRAMLGRDASYDGVFFTAVRTTGVFCRPSCTARKPQPRNVEYFSTVRDALLAGYRPCKRCRPMDANGRPPDWVERLLGRVEAAPADRMTDAAVRSLGIDPSRARRYFRSHYGMSFQAYHRSRRMGMALGHLRAGDGGVDVALRHGYESLSGFRDAFARTFQEPPGRHQRVGCVMTTSLSSPVGPLVAGATEQGVCLLEFADRPALPRQLGVLRRRLDAVPVPGRNRHLDCLEEELGRYFDGRLTRFEVPLVAPGTPFQESVWAELQRIPYGETCSYEALARRVGRPGAQRAVGRANGDNRIAIVIPCHRVVQKDGGLRGYGGGLWRKKFLLDLEQSPRSERSSP